MPIFTPLTHDENLREIIKTHFNVSLDIEGGWGYTKEEATVINDFHTIPAKQLEHTFASMRAYGEMSMTLPKEERYGSINVNELSREKVNFQDRIFDNVQYEVSAIKERDYAGFIDEYKEGYGNASFDMEDHFRRRKEATLKRTIAHWFDITDATR